MSITAVPISIRVVRVPIAARSGKGEASWRAKWWTRKKAPSSPSSSAATASSIDWRRASDAVRVAEWGESCQWPKERKPSRFIACIDCRRPAQRPSSQNLYAEARFDRDSRLPPRHHPLVPPSHPVTELPQQSPPSDPPASRAPLRRSSNEAAHKLGDWPVGPVPRRDGPGEPSEAVAAASDDDRDVVAHASKAVLGLGPLGIVYGDLGTSPLYTVQTIFTAHRNVVHANIAGDYGIASLIFWALMIEVSFKYAVVIMGAHNRGDGGIMALTALVKRRRVPRSALLVTLGIFGAGLFFGDGM